ncbi:D-inositol-3-phosphate glycosyltransferase [Brevibacterium daeguense]|uniref:D-inositol 3-phosphate glycosyltransferase n=2 Tax=Brevibacterium daeguense TaxID=909936 RepID=A0ABP8EGT1_9MICO|nr:glycosyltransferase [Brevibacterium daeguense]
MNVYVQATARQLARLGHQVEIFTADPQAPTSGSVVLAPGVRLHQLTVPAEDKDELAEVVAELAAEIAVHPALTEIDLVWAHYWISGAVALELRAQTPLAISFHTIAEVKDRDTGRQSEPAERVSAERAIAAAADILVANTSQEAADLQQLLGAAGERIVVAPPGVDHEIFTPGPMQLARRAVGEESADLLLLYVGRMQHVKGTDTAIDGFAALRRLDPVLAARTRLVMLGAASGHDADDAAFTERIGRAGLADQVEILPPVPAETLVQWYRAADVVLVPSRSESFGFAAAEAAAVGVPVVASAVGGLEYIVEAGVTGLLVAEDDPLTWARALEILLPDPALRARMGESAHRRAQRFDWHQCVAAVVAAAERRHP